MMMHCDLFKPFNTLISNGPAQTQIFDSFLSLSLFFCMIYTENRLNEPTKMSIKSENDVLSILAQASKRRHIRNTKMNSVSSRSHAVFTIYLGIKHAEMDIRESVINIVDLAGSEGFGKTGNALGSKAHFEGKFINESLAAFKRVINAMSSGQSHIPYRDTVITKFLKGKRPEKGQVIHSYFKILIVPLTFLFHFNFVEALNPQSYLTLLGCVSPYQNDYGETLSTLIFVSEAKQLKRTPQLNAVISDFQARQRVFFKVISMVMGVLIFKNFPMIFYRNRKPR